MRVCAECEGDESCQIQDDMRHPDYNCPIPERFRGLMSQHRVDGQHRLLYQSQRDEARKKLEAVKKLQEKLEEWRSLPAQYQTRPHDVLIKVDDELTEILDGSYFTTNSEEEKDA